MKYLLERLQEAGPRVGVILLLVLILREFTLEELKEFVDILAIAVSGGIILVPDKALSKKDREKEED